MPDRFEIRRRLEKPGIVAVVRARSREQALPLSRALLAGGVVAIEITMTTPGAIEAIREVSQALGPEALVGVGTVLDRATAEAAAAAGARFVVTPICRVELVAAAHAAGVPVMLGAYTPTEAQLAHEAGADYVKLFPAEGLGPAFIKSLRAPLPHLRVVPTGGVDLNTMEGFFKAGCAAVGVGSSLLTPDILEHGKWDELTALARRFVEKALAVRP
jgi:2-dehydro-3-deoxyphosphogluconate aldolase/(4S)-4-hydroxy-2-oxoglutarate aldolase